MEVSTTTLQSGMRTRAYMDAPCAEAVPRWIGCQRVIYNGKVVEDRYYKTFARKALALTGEPVPLDQTYAQFKDDELTPWLSEVPAQVLRNGAVRWMTAKQRQFKGLAKAPRLRRRSDFNSVLITSELFRFVPDPKPEPGFAPHQIELGTKAKPIGRIRFRPTGPYKVPKQITLRQCAGR